MKKHILDRLADKMLVGDGCWQWIGATAPNGYGSVHRDGRTQYTHRVVYELLIGPIPTGYQIDHLCKNRGCVRPDHLEPVTQRENILRGDGPSAQCARWTHCPRGHAFDEENTMIVGSQGKRRCRACDLMRRARRAA